MVDVYHVVRIPSFRYMEVSIRFCNESILKQLAYDETPAIKCMNNVGIFLEKLKWWRESLTQTAHGN